MVSHSEKFTNGAPDVVVLCGGEGTRLSSVLPNDPKSLAKIGERAFLDILLKKLFDEGFNRVILAVGHMKEKIVERYSADSRITFSTEESLLGTGGAVINALGLVKTNNFFVLNGDSYCDLNFGEVYKKHLDKNPLVSMVLAESDNVSDSGNVALDEDNKITSFNEKPVGQGKGLVNAGIYIFNQNIKSHRPAEEKFSLEKDFFPDIVKKNFCYGHIAPVGFLDIGTPERYELAKQRLI